jgi:hypothetical protein
MQSRALDGYPIELNERTTVVRPMVTRDLAIRNVTAEGNGPMLGVRAPQSVSLSAFADVTFAVMTMLASVAAVAWVLNALMG